MRRIAATLLIGVSIIANSLDAGVHIHEQMRPHIGQIELKDPIDAIFHNSNIKAQMLLMPADGRVSSTYGWRRDPMTGGRRFHSGIDLANLRESTVRAAAGGRVLRAGWAAGCGREILIEHGGGISTRYCHLNEGRVRRGESVMAGEAIGAMGSSGRATGPHLHFELIRMGRAVDPSPYLSLWSIQDYGDGIVAMNVLRGASNNPTCLGPLKTAQMLGARR